MSTSDPSAFEESIAEFVQMKEQMAEMIRMMQQLVVGGGCDSFGPNQKGPTPQTDNKARPLPNPI